MERHRRRETDRIWGRPEQSEEGMGGVQDNSPILQTEEEIVSESAEVIRPGSVIPDHTVSCGTHT